MGVLYKGNQRISPFRYSIPKYCILKELDSNNKLINSESYIMDLSDVEDVAAGVLSGAYTSNTSVTSVNLSGLKNVSGYRAFWETFRGCTNLTGAIDFSSLITVSGNCAFGNTFYGCTGITSVNLSNLQTITNSQAFYYCFYGCTGITGALDLSGLTSMYGSGLEYAFQNCTGITSVDMHNLEYITTSGSFQSTFNGCTNLTSFNLNKFKGKQYSGSDYGPSTNAIFANCQSLTTARLPSLVNVQSSGTYGFCMQMFYNCTSLENIYFYALDTTSFGSGQGTFYNMLVGVTGCTVHFPKRIQSTISSWSDVINGFGGTNTVVLFDIITTIIGANGNSYLRQEKDSTSTATAWNYNDVLYYTSGTSEPTVGTTIYSDSACTTSVTTASSIS